MFGLPPFRLCPARGRAATELDTILCPVVSNSEAGQLPSRLRCSQFSNLGWAVARRMVGREDLNLRLPVRSQMLTRFALLFRCRLTVGQAGEPITVTITPFVRRKCAVRVNALLYGEIS
jgi:hypothetical protein